MSAGNDTRGFCPDPLWDWNATWGDGAEDPNLTRCFRRTVLPALPVAAELALFHFWLSGIRTSTHVPHRFRPTLLWSLKIGLTCVLAVNLLAQLLWDLWSPGVGYSLSLVLWFFLNILGLVIVSVITTAEHWARRPTSALPSIYWTLYLFCSIPEFKAQVVLLCSHLTVTTVSESASFFPVVVALLLLQAASDRDSHTDNGFDGARSPEETASFFSRLFFSWLDNVISTGRKRVLQQEDVPPASECVNPAINSAAFAQLWRREQARAGNSSKPASIWRASAWLVWPRMSACLVIVLLRTALTFAHPILLRLLIAFFQSDQPKWKGFFYAGVMLVAALAYVLTFSHYIHQAIIAGIQLRNGLVAAVHRKSLTLSAGARAKYSTGEITNLASSDAAMITDTFGYVPHLVCDPLIAILAVYFLFAELGVAALAGVAFLVALVPFNVLAGNRIKAYQSSLQEAKDLRLCEATEAFSGVAVLKMFTWERAFARRINAHRDKEVIALRKAAWMDGFVALCFSAAPAVALALVFGLYVVIDPVNNVLTAEKIFVSLALFNAIRDPLEIFPSVLFDTVRMVVSINRIGNFLNAEEVNNGQAVDRTAAFISDANAVEIRDGVFAWQTEGEGFCLEVEELTVPKGSLVAVVGRVGAGKSSLLSTILGETYKRSGCVRVDGSPAYVPQQPWILNRTLRENVKMEERAVGGLGASSSLYKNVLRACCLNIDLRSLPAGDRTEIGENGVNLSGGQRARVSLARAVMAERDLYLLDDPLSAVDTAVAEKIFERVISAESGMLKDKTRVMVTHRTRFLPRADMVVLVEEGKVVAKGRYEDLLAEGKLNQVKEEEQKEQKVLEDNKDAKKRVQEEEEEGLDSGEESNPLLQEANEGQLIETEEAEVGRVRWSIYLDYVKVCGVPNTLFVLAFFAFGQVLHFASVFILSRWADRNTAGNSNFEPGLFLGVFSAVAAVEAAVVLSRQVRLNLGCADASERLHRSMLDRVLSAPMSFYDATPVGRIVNRFSGDLGTADFSLPNQLGMILWCVVDMASMVVAITYASIYFLPFAMAATATFFFVLVYYISSARQLKRLEAVSQSPVLSHFHGAISGADSVRAFGSQLRFQAEFEDLLEANTRCHYLNSCSYYWLSARLDVLGAAVVFATSALVVAGRGLGVSPGLAGLCVAYSVECLTTTSWMVNLMSRMEMSAVSLERIFEYIVGLPRESTQAAAPVSEDWPSEGGVQFKDFTLRYREGLEPSLRELNLDVRPGEKLGICGRTGAGKTSLVRSLFRMVDSDGAVGGRLKIDGVDVSTVELSRLRRSLSVIPQEPTLFSGSLRFNLDPSESHADSELWRALELAHLRDLASSLEGGLLHQVQEGGSNLSVGQRQLVCLARALLAGGGRERGILVLDEATASVDAKTDSLIRTTVREAFSGWTVLTVAHRMDTIADSDRVAVMDSGRLAEIGRPEELATDTASIYHRLLRS